MRDRRLVELEWLHLLVYQALRVVEALRLLLMLSSGAVVEIIVLGISHNERRHYTGRRVVWISSSITAIIIVQHKERAKVQERLLLVTGEVLRRLHVKMALGHLLRRCMHIDN